MTKKQLHTKLRGLKKDLQYIHAIPELITLSLKGHEITTELFKKGVSQEDLKLMLDWNVAKDNKRDEILRNGVA